MPKSTAEVDVRAKALPPRADTPFADRAVAWPVDWPTAPSIVITPQAGQPFRWPYAKLHFGRVESMHEVHINTDDQSVVKSDLVVCKFDVGGT